MNLKKIVKPHPKIKSKIDRWFDKKYIQPLRNKKY